MIPMFSTMGALFIAATAISNDPMDWVKFLANYGVAGLWIWWLQRIYGDMVKRDDKRHDDNLKVQNLHHQGLERLNLLIVTALGEIKEFSPRSLVKIIEHAGEGAHSAIRESRTERNEPHP